MSCDQAPPRKNMVKNGVKRQTNKKNKKKSASNASLAVDWGGLELGSHSSPIFFVFFSTTLRSPSTQTTLFLSLHIWSKGNNQLITAAGHFSFYLFFLLHYFFLSLFVLAACFDLSYLSLPRVNFLSNKLCGFRQERILSALTLLRLCGQLALIGMWYGPFHISEQAPEGTVFWLRSPLTSTPYF